MDWLLAQTENIPDSWSNVNFPSLIVLGVAAVPMIIVMIRWTLKVQKDFMIYYQVENEGLRKRQDELEAENEEKAKTIFELEHEVQNCKLAIARHEFTIEQQRLVVKDHERTIEKLGGIIERRKLDRDE